MKIIRRSPAKINLVLEVTNKRVDGYHSLRTVILKLENIFDEVVVEINPDGTGIKVDSDSEAIPKDGNNTCYKTAQNFLRVINQKVGLNIYIKKRIPVAAGLGGGSSNAATLLMILNDYFKQPLSQSELAKLAVKIGADVPLFLISKNITYLKGVGNRVVFKKDWKKRGYFLLINPNLEISTHWAYENLASTVWFMKKKRMNISEKLIQKINQSNTLSWNSLLYNDFELLIEKEYPVVRELKQALKAFGANGALMSGAGPTVFGVFDSLVKAKKAERVIKKQYPSFCYLIN
ncbi:MAG TPA: 4-(cytidine 5'-diphospho)-2-C-methyl-D-erythritol kinase [Candidatus Moranbacteria bacterium]|nr:4-(cytidine 5'-diphospho)-2-C-methyl-D-erythritol kinase [Candidatus Moranbacteria bacterium]